MTLSYATCAYIGCDTKIAYDYSEKSTRPRYCIRHEEIMRDRNANRVSPGHLYTSLYIDTYNPHKRCKCTECGKDGCGGKE